MTVPHKIELEKKWWHRLSITLIWIATGLAAVFSLLAFYASYTSGYEFNPYTLLFLLVAPVLYIVLLLIYRKIVLYIIFGKDEKKLLAKLNLNRLLSPIIVVKKHKSIAATVLILALIIGFFAFQKNKQDQVRDLRYQLYEANLRFANATKPSEYLAMVGFEQYTWKSQMNTITDSKETALYRISSDISDIDSSCTKIPTCKEQLSDPIDKMKTAINAAIEYYDGLKAGNSQDGLFTRDKAFEISRTIRMDYLISPDPKIESFTNEQTSNLIDEQWNLNFVDFVQEKKICDDASDYMKQFDAYQTACQQQDYYKSMYTFNFADDGSEDTTGLGTVCNLEKNYMNTKTCPITLSKVKDARKEFFDYLSTHENAYLGMSASGNVSSTDSSSASSQTSEDILKLMAYLQFGTLCPKRERLEITQAKESILFGAMLILH
jgi:hypothetical protein